MNAQPSDIALELEAALVLQDLLDARGDAIEVDLLAEQYSHSTDRTRAQLELLVGRGLAETCGDSAYRATSQALSYRT